MKTVLIGAGNLMTNLGKALRQAEGVEICQVWSRTETSARALGERLDADYTTDLKATAEADVYIIAVKDSALEKVIGELVPCHPDAVFLHTAGSMPLGVFGGKAKHYGVFYPMQTFSKDKEVNFREIPVFLEANDETTISIAKTLAKAVSDDYRELSTEQRRYLHLAAVFACNFANHCYDLAAQVLEQHDIPFSVMLPLIDETARKVHSLSPREAQTGPAVRYDENVMARQKALIDNENIRQIYELLSRSIHERVESIGV